MQSQEITKNIKLEPETPNTSLMTLGCKWFLPRPRHHDLMKVTETL